jgi:DCN1-like protein 1/2
MKGSKKSGIDKQMEENIVQFCGVTNASTRDARRYLEKYKRIDVAINAFFSDPPPPAAAGAPSTTKLNTLFDKYKDPDEGDIRVEGTMQWCEDLGISPDDVVTLALAFELGSKSLGEWQKKEWVDGWKKLGCAPSAGQRPQFLALKCVTFRL